jgi:hypothetical protein
MMKALRIILGCGLFLTGPAFGQEPAPLPEAKKETGEPEKKDTDPDAEFMGRVAEGKATMAEMLERLRVLKDVPPPANTQRSTRLSTLIRELPGGVRIIPANPAVPADLVGGVPVLPLPARPAAAAETKPATPAKTTVPAPAANPNPTDTAPARVPAKPAPGATAKPAAPAAVATDEVINAPAPVPVPVAPAVKPAVPGAKAEPVPVAPGVKPAVPAPNAVPVPVMPAGQVAARPVLRLPQIVTRVGTSSSSSATSSPFQIVFSHACQKAGPEDLAALGAVLAELPAKHPEFAVCFEGLTLATLRVTTERLQQQTQKPAVPPTQEEPPAAVANGPPELRAAWKTWNSIAGPYRAIAKVPPPAAAPALPEDLTTPLRDFLREPKEGAWKGLLQTVADVEADPWLRIESTSTRTLRNGVILSLLHDGKLAEALGMLCQNPVLGPPSTIAPTATDLNSRLSLLLAAAGFDWEQLLLGSLVSEDADGAMSLRSRQRGALRPLAVSGSARSVQLALQIVREKKMETMDSIYFLASALRTPPKANADPATDVAAQRIARITSSTSSTTTRIKELPADVRQELVQAMAAHLRVEGAGTLSTLQYVLTQVPRDIVPELREALEALLKHPSHLIAGKARTLLAEQKLVDPETPIAAPPPPLRLRLKVDGQPLANMAVQVYTSELGRQASTTDAQGEISVSLESVLDPSRVKSLQLVACPTGPRGTASKEDAEVWRGPWIDTTLAVSPGATEPVEAAFTTATLELALDPRSSVKLKAPAQIRMKRTDGSNYISNSTRVAVPFTDSLTFEGLQIETYQLTIFAEGAAYQEIPRLALGKTGSIRLIKLEPGRSVKAKILTPAGQDLTLISNCTLLQDGETVPLHYATDLRQADGLPLGKYHLHLPSTAEQEEARRKKKLVFYPAEDRHEGWDLDFELTAESPAVVDLGEIRLKAAKK